MASSVVAGTMVSDLDALSRACGIPLASYRRAHVEACIERSRTRNGVASADSLSSVLHRKLASTLRRGGSLLLGRSEMLLRPGEFGLEQLSRHVFRRVAS